MGTCYNVVKVGSAIRDVDRHATASAAIVHIVFEIPQLKVVRLGQEFHFFRSVPLSCYTVVSLLKRCGVVNGNAHGRII